MRGHRRHGAEEGAGEVEGATTRLLSPDIHRWRNEGLTSARYPVKKSKATAAYIKLPDGHNVCWHPRLPVLSPSPVQERLATVLVLVHIGGSHRQAMYSYSYSFADYTPSHLSKIYVQYSSRNEHYLITVAGSQCRPVNPLSLQCLLSQTVDYALPPLSGDLILGRPLSASSFCLCTASFR